MTAAASEATRAAGEILAAALAYADRGWQVFPVKPDKDPWTPNGFKDASDDPEQLAFWWRQHPTAGVAIATGAVSGLDVIDEDTPKGGARGRAELEKRIGPLPPTYEVLSGGGGKHFYFAHPGVEVPCSVRELGTGLDVRGDGGYIIAPPTIHGKTRRPYKLLHERELAPWPAALLNGSEDRRNGHAPALADEIPEGERNATLTSCAGTIRRRGAGEAEIYALLSAMNVTRCKPPLSDRDVRRIARSVAGMPAADPFPAAPAAPKTRIEWQRLSDVDMRSIVFLDRPHFQAAAFHLLAGRKGMGKGTLLAMVAAKVTRGELGERPNVVWIGSEDSASIDIKPRLVAAGGDPERVLVVKDGWIQLPHDVDRISAAMEEMGEVGMLIVDPVGNHITGKNSNSETDIRDAIGPLNGIADRHDCMVFGVRHLSEKECAQGVLAAILGSSAWVQVPRAVLAVARDEVDASISHLQCIAGNRLPPGTPGRMFQISGVLLPGLKNEVTKATWLGESTKDVEQMLKTTQAKEPSKSAAASKLILDILDGVPSMESDTLDARVAGEIGVAAKTVQNIRTGLKEQGLVRVYPEKDEDGIVVRWFCGRTLAPRPDPDSRQAVSSQIPTLSDLDA